MAQAVKKVLCFLVGAGVIVAIGCAAGVIGFAVTFIYETDTPMIFILFGSLFGYVAYAVPRGIRRGSPSDLAGVYGTLTGFVVFALAAGFLLYRFSRMPQVELPSRDLVVKALEDYRAAGGRFPDDLAAVGFGAYQVPEGKGEWGFNYRGDGDSYRLCLRRWAPLGEELVCYDVDTGRWVADFP